MKRGFARLLLSWVPTLTFSIPFPELSAVLSFCGSPPFSCKRERERERDLSPPHSNPLLSCLKSPLWEMGYFHAQVIIPPTQEKRRKAPVFFPVMLLLFTVGGCCDLCEKWDCNYKKKLLVGREGMSLLLCWRCALV